MRDRRARNKKKEDSFRFVSFLTAQLSAVQCSAVPGIRELKRKLDLLRFPISFFALPHDAGAGAACWKN